MDDTLLVVVGPTASGKTELAVRLAEALDGEIIGADSVQIYRHFDVGSGKPTPEQLCRAPHHLVDVLDPLDAMDAAAWTERADAAVADIKARGKRPIVCGGTFLWVKALLYGLAPAPPADNAIRERHRSQVAREGRAALHRALATVDPETSTRLSPNDFVRVSRALEVFELTGIPMSHWQHQHGFRQPRYRARLMGVRHARDALDQRIRQRVEQMLGAGWIAEVRQLLDSGYVHARAMRSVGYRQIADALGGDHAAADPPGLSDAIYRATRVFARRQRTWLRDQAVQWLDPKSAASAMPHTWL